MRTEDNRIPVVIGVTGHRKMRERDTEAIARSVESELRKLQAACPHSPLVMLSSLAEGGDLLCAEIAGELGVPLIAALPRPLEDYEADFSEEGKERLARQCGRAEQVFVAPYTERVTPEGVTRDFQFRQAGIYVVSHSHVLLALWDGGPGTEAACGTAECVDFALNGTYAPGCGVALRSGSNEAVIHVVTPRADDCVEEAGTVHILGRKDFMLDVLRKTDDFNQHAGKLPPDAESRLPTDAADDPELQRMEAIGRSAGQLSRFYAKRYRRVLGLLAVASALLTFAFLMYDNLQIIWMILACGLMLAMAWLCQRYAARSDCHRRYIEYRALSECLRVQTYLRYAGSRTQAADLMTWTQQEETAWIMDALCAMNVGGPPETGHEIRACWVEAQREYHRKAAGRSLRNLWVSERIVSLALILSIALYLLAVVFELLFGGLTAEPVIRLADADSYRTVLKILLGTISAVTLFVANYYGRLSLPRTLSDHRKMEHFYSRLSAQLERRGQQEELLEVLAREELIENGNWCSYQRDNKPDMSI